MFIKLGAIYKLSLSTKEHRNCNKVKWTRVTMIFPVIQPKPTQRCDDLRLVKGGTQPLSSDPKIKLGCHGILPYISTRL
jgi:hypothetical protein